MAKNEFLPFGTAEGANVLSNQEYEALAARHNGFNSGVAKSKELNKVWRQASLIASAVAQFIVDTDQKDLLDTGDFSDIKARLSSAINLIISNGDYVTNPYLKLELLKKIDKADITQQLGNDTGKVVSQNLLNTELGKKASVADVNGKMAKDQNGADIPDKPKFIENLGLPELLNLKRDKTDNIFPAVTFKPEGAEDVFWLAYDEQKKQFAIAFNTGGVAKYVYLQNKAGSFALEEQVTAQAILTKLLQVDGSGSGLDADLVRGLPADFSNLSETNGYQKFPGGLLMQWGVSGQSPTDIYIKFPIAFTRPPHFVGESSNSGRYTTSVWTANDITNVGFNATQVCVLSNASDKVNPPGNYATNWLAIGFYL